MIYMEVLLTLLIIIVLPFITGLLAIMILSVIMGVARFVGHVFLEIGPIGIIILSYILGFIILYTLKSIS